MRLNQYIARTTHLSRRAADEAIGLGRVRVNGQPAIVGMKLGPDDRVILDNKLLSLAPLTTTILLYKPTGYVCSRRGQGSKTIYELLPEELRALQPIGRLDKETSGLLLLTDDGELAQKLAHPKYGKEKVYDVTLNHNVASVDVETLKTGVMLEDGLSRFTNIEPISQNQLQVTLSEGRNRQIRRTFEVLGYRVTALHRTQFGSFTLPPNLDLGKFTTT